MVLVTLQAAHRKHLDTLPPNRRPRGSPDSGLSDLVDVVLKKDDADKGTTFKVHLETPLGDVLRAYCVYRGYDYTTTRFQLQPAYIFVDPVKCAGQYYEALSTALTLRACNGQTLNAHGLLCEAAMENDPSGVARILEANPAFVKTAVHTRAALRQAITDGAADVVRCLLAHGSEDLQATIVPAALPDARQLALQAALSGSPAAIRAVLDYLALGDEDDVVCEAVSHAARLVRLEAVQCLLQYSSAFRERIRQWQDLMLQVRIAVIAVDLVVTLCIVCGSSPPLTDQVPCLQSPPVLLLPSLILPSSSSFCSWAASFFHPLPCNHGLPFVIVLPPLFPAVQARAGAAAAPGGVRRPRLRLRRPHHPPPSRAAAVRPRGAPSGLPHRDLGPGGGPRAAAEGAAGARRAGGLNGPARQLAAVPGGGQQQGRGAQDESKRAGNGKCVK